MVNLDLEMKLLNQLEDPLLSREEAEKVETIIHHIKDTSVAQGILSPLKEKNIPEDIDAREVFYITRRASIMDAINNSSQDIADILRENFPEVREKIPMSVVMAMIINDIIITLCDYAQLSHIHRIASDSSYRTAVTVNGKRKYGNSSHKVQKPAKSLRTILQKRNQLYYEQNIHKTLEEKAQQDQILIVGLIKKGILQENNGIYKIRNLSRTQARRSNAYKISCRVQKEGKTFSITRSTSEHGEQDAYKQVIEGISKHHNLSPHERSILMKLNLKK